MYIQELVYKKTDQHKYTMYHLFNARINYRKYHMQLTAHRDTTVEALQGGDLRWKVPSAINCYGLQCIPR